MRPADAAFEAAGFKNAFRVEPLPPGMDPLAIGVNIITWVPRSSRGWSYGMSIVDPRTGEILKSTVRLDGMRLRFDRRLLEGLTEPYAQDGSGPSSIHAVLLQRLRNLAAHEVGHGLGLRHQHIESAQSDSSTGYPFPKINLTPRGKLVLMTPYGTGVGDWDKIAIQYGYRQFGAGEQESAGLERLLTQARARGYYWMTDEDTV